MNERPQFYAIKVLYPVESTEMADRIDWCKENKMDFFNQSIMGCMFANKYYTEEEMREIGTLTLNEQGNVAEIDLDRLPPKCIGCAFVFKNEMDAIAFKLRWM